MYVHRDKLKRAIELLEKGFSQKEIAKTCGLSMTQVSAIGREYGYYVNVKEHFEKLKEEKRKEFESWRKARNGEKKRLEKELEERSKRVKELEGKEKELLKSVEELGQAKEILEQKVKNLMKLREVCFYFQPHREEVKKGVESLERVIGVEMNKFFEELEALTNPELIKDLKELRGVINHTGMLQSYREYIMKKFERVEVALIQLAMLLSVKEPLKRLFVLTELMDICEVLDMLGRREGGMSFSMLHADTS